MERVGESRHIGLGDWGGGGGGEEALWYINKKKAELEHPRQLIMDKLSCTELGHLLDEKGLCGVADAVVDNDISGELLVELTEAEIKEIAPKIGDRVKLRKLISQSQVPYILHAW